MNTVMNFKGVDYRTNPLFFGEPLSLQRFDQLKYPRFYKLAEAQNKQIWHAEEISLQKDRNDYKSLSANERRIFDLNLRYQTLGDSCLSRSITSLQQYVTNTELEACMDEWRYFESRIHSPSYTHIFKSVYPDESRFWDTILQDEEIKNRLAVFTNSFDSLFEDDEKSLKHKIFNAVVQTNVTESLSFYVSFACSFFFAAKGVMEGNGKIIKLIERDEILHAAITTDMLQIFRDVPSEGFQEVYDEDKIAEAYRIGIENECRWADYLFQDGNLLGLSRDQFKGFASYRADERLKKLGLQGISSAPKTNPLGSWYQEFIKPQGVQLAPQETEVTDYLIGAVDFNDVDLSGLSF